MSAVFFFYRHLCLSVDQFPSVELKKGRSPGEETKEARGGCMQHQGEDGGGEQGKEVRRLKILKPLEEAERRREGASELEKWKGMGSKRVRVLDKRQAGGGATFKRKHINREFEFQSSSKMMSFSQKCHSIITNQLKKKKKKTAKKEKKVAGVCVVVSICLSTAVSFVRTSFVAILTWRSRLSSKVAQDMGVEIPE